MRELHEDWPRATTEQALLTGAVIIGVALPLIVGADRVAIVFSLALLAGALAFIDIERAAAAVILALALLPVLAAAGALEPSGISYAAIVAGLALVVASVTVLRHGRGFIDVPMAFLVLVPLTGLAAHGFTASGLLSLWYVTPLTALALYAMVLLSRVEGDWILKILFALMVVQSVLGIGQSLVGQPVFADVLPALHESQRGYLGYLVPSISRSVQQGSGTFDHFNALGALLVMGVPMAFVLWRRRRTLLRLSLLGLLACGVVTTYSRGALLGAATGTFVAYVLEEHRRKAWLFFSVAAVLLLGGFGYGAIRDYADDTGQFGPRRATWAYALQTARNEPSELLIGYGYRHFRADVLAGGGPTGTLPQGVQKSIHSGPLQVLLETGVLGLALFFIGFIVVPLTMMVRRRDGPTLALGGAILGFVVSQAFDNALLGYQGAIMVVLLALLMRYVKYGDDSLSRRFSAG